VLGEEISSRKPAPNVEVLTGILLVERNRYHPNRQRWTLTIGSDFNDNRISAGIIIGLNKEFH
jgi:hypothetical protein